MTASYIKQPVEVCYSYADFTYVLPTKSKRFHKTVSLGNEIE